MELNLERALDEKIRKSFPSAPLGKTAVLGIPPFISCMTLGIFVFFLIFNPLDIHYFAWRHIKFSGMYLYTYRAELQVESSFDYCPESMFWTIMSGKLYITAFSIYFTI